MKVKTWVIYCSTRIDTGQNYVGQTHRGFKRRKREHFAQADSDRLKRFHNALKAHGEEKFTWLILVGDITTLEEANKLEIEWIKRLNAHISCGGYNLTLGGGGSSGFNHTSASRAKIGSRFKGIPKSEEQRKKMGASISAARRGKTYGPRPFKNPEQAKINAVKSHQNIIHKTGWHHSEEAIQHMRHKHGQYHCGVCGEVGHSRKKHAKETS